MANPPSPETPEIHFHHLLCERCKTVLEAARIAQNAVDKLKELTGGGQSLALPAGIPGRHLSRQERLEKAKTILPSLKAPPVARSGDIMHQTSGGTVVARPWLAEPRKKITKAAEHDLARVVSGKITQRDWCEKHAYSRALLHKRLAMLGASRRPPGKNPVVDYKPPSKTLSDADIQRVLDNEITGNALAKQLGMAVGTVYRLVGLRRVELEHGAKAKKAKPRGRHSNLQIPDEDLELIYANRCPTLAIAEKHGCGNNAVLDRVREYAQRVHGVKWKPKFGKREYAGGGTPEAPAADDKQTEMDVFEGLTNALSAQ